MPSGVQSCSEKQKCQPFLAAFLAGFFAAFFAAIAVSPRVLVVPHNAGKPHTDGPAGMLHAHWFVIAMFSAPACVIRQYAGYIWYDVDIFLTIGKRWVNGQNHPCTDETRRIHKKLNKIRSFSYYSVC